MKSMTPKASPDPSAEARNMTAAMSMTGTRPILLETGPANQAPTVQPMSAEETEKPLSASLRANWSERASTAPLMTAVSNPKRNPPRAAATQMPMIRALIRLTDESGSSEIDAGEEVVGGREDDDCDDGDDSAMVCFLTSGESHTALASCRAAWRTPSGYDRARCHSGYFVILFPALASAPVRRRLARTQVLDVQSIDSSGGSLRSNRTRHRHRPAVKASGSCRGLPTTTPPSAPRRRTGRAGGGVSPDG